MTRKEYSLQKYHIDYNRSLKLKFSHENNAILILIVEPGRLNSRFYQRAHRILNYYYC